VCFFADPDAVREVGILKGSFLRWFRGPFGYFLIQNALGEVLNHTVELVWKNACFFDELDFVRESWEPEGILLSVF
jgi:hypothetical protein